MKRLCSDRTGRRLALCLVLALLVILTAIFADALAPQDPYAQDMSQALQPPSAEHLLGTDTHGRDVLSRVIAGARLSVFSALGLVAAVCIVGSAAGILCGWFGGVLDTVLLRIGDLFLAFPGMVLAIAVAGLLGGGMGNAMLALALVSWPKYARLARSQTLSVRNAPYITAAVMAGNRPGQLMVRHILPNIAGPLLVTAALDIGAMMMELAGLSFLGLGAQSPAAEWGSMMSKGRSMIQTAPWTILAPGGAIFLTVLIFNLLGDTLRDYLDPRRSRRQSERRPSMKRKNRRIALLCLVLILAALLTACGNSGTQTSDGSDESVFRYGTVAYGPEMGNTGLNPHDNYTGWSTVRYGVGETLFRFSESMELEPWLAESWQWLDDTTLEIQLRQDVTFSSGRQMDGEAVKECLENLIAVHDRAPGDLKIASIDADGYTVTITCSEPNPALPNYLSDPYGAIIDMSYGTDGVDENRNVAGTGPFVAYEVADDHIYLQKNENYWGGEVLTDRVEVTSITDGDTLTMALQSGQLDAVQGLPYASISLFSDESKYTISSADTSRVFFGAFNFDSPVLSDARVRRAIAMAIDKESFTEVLLHGNGTPATGPFPASFAFGADAVTAPGYDPDAARALLAEAGWTDTDGDGYVDKDGQPLTIRWVTYPGRQELPILAEAAQATLKDIGIQVEVNSTANHLAVLEDGDWDVYVSAFVAAPTGDPAYFFTTHCLKDSVKNRGGYESDALEALAAELRSTFDEDRRAELAVEMSQQLLDDDAFFFTSYLKMNFVMQSDVQGFTAHPSDYYEITAQLQVG